MSHEITRFVRASRLYVIVAAFCLLSCQLKSAPVTANLVTVDTAQFALHSVDRYTDPQNGDNSLIVVKATYTNPEGNPEQITASKFALLDPNMQAVYVGLSGGNIYVPSMTDTRLDPGKSTEIALAFRVPTSMLTARLVYRQ